MWYNPHIIMRLTACRGKALAVADGWCKPMTEPVAHSAEQTGGERPLLAWLTVERLLYGMIFLAALAIRLAALGRWPLDEAGANTALAAWRTIQGSTWRSELYSPLLYDVNLLLFYLTRATDASARLLPALGGALLTLTPYGLRDLLGRRGALATAALFAFSPTWVHFSRRADGAALPALAVILLLLAAARYHRTRDGRAWRLGAIALGAGLTAGPGIYTPLLALGVIGLATWLLRGRWPSAWRTLQDLALGLRREHAYLLGGVFLLLASGLTFNPGGIGASVNLAGQWAGVLRSGRQQWPWHQALRNLAVYEHLTVALSLVGVARACRRWRVVDMGLLLWLGLALLLSVPLGHRASFWLPGLMLPLTLLAGRGVEWAWGRLFAHFEWQDLAVWAILTTPLAFAYLELANYLFAGQSITLWFSAGALALLILAWAGYWLWTQRQGALTVGVLLLLVTLLIPTVRASTALAYQTGLDPREPILDGWAPAAEWRQFESFLTHYSARQAGDPHLLEIAYEPSFDPWLSWYLRDYPQARSVPDVRLEVGTAALIAPAQAEPPQGGYVGQRFRWRERWEPQRVSTRDWIRWFLMRDRVGALAGDRLEIWVLTPAVE